MDRRRGLICEYARFRETGNGFDTGTLAPQGTRGPEVKTGIQRASLLLTFDDGPGADPEPKSGSAHQPLDALKSILKTLEDNGIKAEFYLVGQEVKAFPDAAKLIVKQGHTLQNHSWSHPNIKSKGMVPLPEKDVLAEVEKTQKIIKDTTGVTPTKFRPPYGAGMRDPEIVKVAKALSLTLVYWDIDTRDWAAPRGLGPEKLNSREKEKSIYDQLFNLPSNKGKTKLNVLLHVIDPTARDLPAFISKLKEWGFTTFANP